MHAFTDDVAEGIGGGLALRQEPTGSSKELGGRLAILEKTRRMPLPFPTLPSSSSTLTALSLLQ